MGIRGMRTYLQRNKLLLPYTLRNTRVVVDGNNICYQLLFCENVRQYGGNYDLIRQRASQFFGCLLASNVQPFVVFDGAYDEDGKKLNYIIRKCEAKIHDCEENPDPHLACFPVLVYQTFLDVLNSLSIAHVACDGDADNQIAVLAKRWQCPVISSNGDMYIFDLQGGFVNFIDIKFDESKSDGIQTKIFYVDHFQQMTGFPKSLLPFTCTILGNVYADIDNIVGNEFFEKLGANSSFSYIRNDLKNAFAILPSVHTEENGLAVLLQCVDDKLPSMEAADLKKKIKSSLTVYKAINDFDCYDLAMYFEGQIKPKHRRPLPDCVMDKIRTGILPGLLIEVTNQRVILKPTLENFDLPPVQEVTRPLRQIVYGLIFKRCPQEQIHSVEENIRSKRAMTRVPVKPVFNIESFGPLPTLDAMLNQGRVYKIQVLSAMFTVNPDSLCRVDQGSALFTIAVRFLIKNVPFAHKLQIMHCYVLCHLILLHKKKRPQLKATYERFVHQNYARDISVFHYFLQCYAECLGMAYTMNALVGLPLQQPDPSTVYDGKFMYNVFIGAVGEIDKLLSHSLLGDELFQLYQAILYVVGETA